MNRKIFDRFGILMSNLKTIEPSSSFDFEFRRRLESAIAEKYEETPIEILARKTVESIRYALLPKVPVLVRTTASIMVLLAIVYIYSSQPLSPILTSKQGIVMVQGARDIGFREASPAQGFKVGDLISTNKGARLDIELSNRYVIRIKENTKIKIARLIPRYGRGKVLLELIEGKMLVSIGEGFKGSNFIVDTDAAQALALGTRFSIDVSGGMKTSTSVNVLEGMVEVKSHYKPEKILLAKQTVIVESGQKTEVTIGGVPLPPRRLIEREWLELEELYQIGKKPKAILLIKNTPDRVKQLLRPCPIYISDEKPREIPKLLEEAVLKIEEAIKTEDKAKHLEIIQMLERMLEEYPNPKYDVQFLLYIGTYYEYISYHEEAIRTFEKVVKKYPASPFASIAQCAIGVIYEEKLHNQKEAGRAFRSVLSRYPNSLEAIWVEKLGIKKLE